jgi:hypothetical protein
MSTQVVLITGALTGIGRASALAFAKGGSRIVVSGRREEAGQTLATELRALGAEAEFIRADVRHEDDVRELVDQTVARFGRLDAAVNNAGTEGHRRILCMNIYPGTRSAALAFLGCNDTPTAVGSMIRKWDAFDLEEQANRAGLQATVVRSAEEFLETEQCRYLEGLPLVDIEKIADGDPIPFTSQPEEPLSGVRALGFSHLIAGPGMGRALAYHGADVLNLWTPNDFEMDFNYYSAHVGMRSAILDFRRYDEMARFRRLVAGADMAFCSIAVSLTGCSKSST